MGIISQGSMNMDKKNQGSINTMETFMKEDF